MAVILRTYGGLGNQLFQVLYGRLFAEKFKIELTEVHDTNYKHKFPRSRILHKSIKYSTLHEKLLSSLRLPKILHRIIRMPEQAIWLFGDAYLDGYFQDASSYAIFDSQAIKCHLRSICTELSIQPAHIDKCLVHLRLGDFFGSRIEARDHAVQRLLAAPPNSSVITNDEELMKDPALSAIFATNKCALVSTKDLSAEEVLRLMTTYRRIDANDSTMVFWASVLGRCQTTLSHASLRATNDLFASILWRTE